MRKDIFIRVITAALLILVTYLSHYILGNQGILYLGVLCAILVVFEYASLRAWEVKADRNLFIGLASLGLITTHLINWPMTALGLWIVLYICCSLAAHRSKATNNEQKLAALLYGAFGFVYVVILPSMILKLLAYDIVLFIGLLFIVFSGDILAYLGGVSLGKNKLYEELSPNKSVEGAISGLLGSLAAGVAWYILFDIDQYLPVPVFLIALLSLGCGVLAQVGDLFESLIKRVAGKKDSGQILPGHGGFLDRFDAIYFSGPLFYFFVESFLKT